VLRFLAVLIVAVFGIGALYALVVLNWNYSSGERAGWVQKFSRKGWVCKTWEGELSMVSMPGASPEKFLFTVRDEAIAAAVNKVMGQRVSLHYEQKVGVPTSCFGETEYWVDHVQVVNEIPMAPGIAMPAPPAPVPAPAPAGAAAPPAPAPAPATPSAPAIPSDPAAPPATPAPAAR
jgi:hypothetical protein